MNEIFQQPTLELYLIVDTSKDIENGKPLENHKNNEIVYQIQIRIKVRDEALYDP